MKISEVPHALKIFKVNMSNGQSYLMSGGELDKTLGSQNNIIRYPNGEGFNKSFIVNWKIDVEATRENVLKNKDKLATK